MTYDELVCAILAVCPNATLSEDNTGQIVIYTDLMEAGEGGLKQHEL